MGIHECTTDTLDDPTPHRGRSVDSGRCTGAICGECQARDPSDLNDLGDRVEAALYVTNRPLSATANRFATSAKFTALRSSARFVVPEPLWL